MRARAIVFIAVALASATAACGGSSKPNAATSAVTWPAPSDPMARAVAAGLVPETAERLLYHVHAHLDVFVDGTPVVVPAGIGIDIDNPAVHTFMVEGNAQYGGINPPCDQPCISPLHTHDVSGVLHTESATKKNNTLGQFFTQWDVRLDENCVATYCSPATPIAFYVDGVKFGGDPRTITLSNLREIAVVIGKPPAKVPDSWKP
jgi:hypothetical protein